MTENQSQSRLLQIWKQAYFTIMHTQLTHLLSEAQQAIQLRQWKKAIPLCLQSLEYKPTQQQSEWIYLQLALISGEQQQLKPALHYFQKVIEYNPNNPTAHSGIGQILHRFEQLERALQHYQQALTYAPTANNFMLTAKTFHRLGQYQQAMLCYKEALKLDPQSAELHFSLSLLQLLQGQYQQGWQRYEARWHLPQRGFMLPITRQPQWQGENLEHHTLLITHEQGFGDSIQFLRYLPLIQANKIVLSCHDSLMSLVANSFHNITVVEANAPMFESYDYFIPLASLPRLFNTQVDSIPQQTPYLKANSARIQQWKTQLTTTTLNIGIVWSGNPKHVNDANRSCDLEYFLQLSQYLSVKLYSLQKGDAVRQLKPDMPIQDCSDQLHNFTDTAALIQALDLVITVDTAVAHLAGALGQKTWLILPYVPDWRWLLNRQDSPWYPTMTLFRQPRIKDWASVFTQLHHELTQLSS